MGNFTNPSDPDLDFITKMTSAGADLGTTYGKLAAIMRDEAQGTTKERTKL